MNYKHWDKGRWDDVTATFAKTQIEDGEHIHSFTNFTKNSSKYTEGNKEYYKLVSNANYAKPMIPTIIFDLFIEKLIFNGPTTIVLWKDGTKTVVKCKEGDVDNKEFAFLYALVEKIYIGPKGSKNEFKRFLDKYISQAEKEEAEKNEKREHTKKKKPESLDKKLILKTADIILNVKEGRYYCSNCGSTISKDTYKAVLLAKNTYIQCAWCGIPLEIMDVEAGHEE